MDDKQRIALIETQTINNGAAVQTAPAAAPQAGQTISALHAWNWTKTAELISYDEYSPYGNTTYQAGRSAAEVSLKRYRYTGKERDEENGLSYHDAGYYAPWLGRWSSVDPDAHAFREWSPYVYSFSSPMKFVDGNGRGPEDAIGLDKMIKQTEAVRGTSANMINNIEQYYSEMIDNGTLDPKAVSRYENTTFDVGKEFEQQLNSKDSSAQRRRRRTRGTTIGGRSEGRYSRQKQRAAISRQPSIASDRVRGRSSRTSGRLGRLRWWT